MLGRAPPTVGRELRRNSRPHDCGRYDANLADQCCHERAGRPRHAKLATESGLKAEVQSKLDMEWSPEQIASHLQTDGLTGRSGSFATRPSTEPSTRARRAT